MRTANLMGLAVLSLSLMSVSTMACEGRKAPPKTRVAPRTCSTPRTGPTCGSHHNNPSWGLGLSFGGPTSEPQPYIPAPEQPSVLTVGGIAYNVDGGGAMCVAAPQPEPTLSQADYAKAMAERYRGYAEQEREHARKWQELADAAREYARQTSNETARQMWEDTAARHEAEAARHNAYAEQDEARAAEYDAQANQGGTSVAMNGGTTSGGTTCGGTTSAGTTSAGTTSGGTVNDGSTSGGSTCGTDSTGTRPTPSFPDDHRDQGNRPNGPTADDVIAGVNTALGTQNPAPAVGELLGGTQALTEGIGVVLKNDANIDRNLSTRENENAGHRRMVREIKDDLRSDASSDLRQELKEWASYVGGLLGLE